MKNTLLICIAGFAISCKNESSTTATAEPEVKQYTQLEKMDWLLGSWGHTSKEGTLTENWVKANDSVYKGESFFIIEKDTVFAEYVDLTEANCKLTYTAMAKGQNDDKPVPFTMTSSDDKNITFENPAHDFPQKIKYNKISNDSLVATISGMRDGKPATETFAMKRQ